MCAEIQGVYNLSQHGRGFHTVVGPAHLANMDDSVCIQCGQCINVCPTAAFLEKSATEDVWKAIADRKKHVAVQTAPSIRAAIGEGFRFAAGHAHDRQDGLGVCVLGFNAVSDTDFAADLTIVEEAHEFLTRLQGTGGPLPMITSCSPGWISFLEKFYPQMIPHASTCRSPMSMLSVLIKTYYAKRMNLDPADIYVVAVMPCVAKKYEAGRPEHLMADGTPYTDAVLTTRELIWMIKCYGITMTTLADGQFDAPLGLASGAGDIFGTTGGVMEATLRAAFRLQTGKPADRLEFTEVRAVEGLRETYVAIGDKLIHVGVANGLTNAKILLEKVIAESGQVPRDRGDGLPGRLHRRRRPALSTRGRQGARRTTAAQAGRRAVCNRQRQDAPRELREPGDRRAVRRLPRRAGLGTGPRAVAHPLSGPAAARYPIATPTRSVSEEPKHQPEA